MGTKILAGIAIVAALFFGVQYYRASERATVAEKKLHAQDFLRNYAADMQPGTFVRATATTFTYTTPVQTTVKGETFIGKEEHTVAYDHSFTVFGGLFGDGPETVTQLKAGRGIRVKTLGTGTHVRITELYVSP